MSRPSPAPPDSLPAAADPPRPFDFGFLEPAPQSPATSSDAGTKQRRPQAKNACVNCKKSCKKCENVRPCPRCIQRGIADSCRDSERKVRKGGELRGPYRRKDKAKPQLRDGGVSPQSGQTRLPQHDETGTTSSSILPLDASRVSDCHSTPLPSSAFALPVYGRPCEPLKMTPMTALTILSELALESDASRLDEIGCAIHINVSQLSPPRNNSYSGRDVKHEPTAFGSATHSASCLQESTPLQTPDRSIV
ncbi:hypothetical protein BDR26DRAFT_865400 [Obelidium mucronatum]|nr:hypothetical protein BDR26DRAFT_865400 [Obelidium mucronatum]